MAWLRKKIYKLEKQKSILHLKDGFSLYLLKISLSTKASHLHWTPTEAPRELTLLTKLAFRCRQSASEL